MQADRIRRATDVRQQDQMIRAARDQASATAKLARAKEREAAALERIAAAMEAGASMPEAATPEGQNDA